MWVARLPGYAPMLSIPVNVEDALKPESPRSTAIQFPMMMGLFLLEATTLHAPLRVLHADSDACASENLREGFGKDAVHFFHLRELAILVMLVFLLLRAGLALDPGQQISQYGHSVWRMQDGVFPAAPQAITQTADGYLWLGTRDGLVRFDGVRFVRWSPPKNTNMTPAVVSLLGGRDGTLWIGAENGVAALNGEHFTFQVMGRVNAIVEDQRGKVWVARSRIADRQGGPLCRVERDSFQCFGEAEGIGFGIQGAEALIGDPIGGLWIGSTKGICHWTGTSGVTYFPKALKSAEGSAGVLAFDLDKDGALLVGTGQSGPGAGLQRFDGNKWSDYQAGAIRGGEISVETMLRDRDGGLWIATTNDGLLHVHNGLVDTFTQADGLSGNLIEALYEDREGNIWAVSPQGLDRFRNLPVVTLGHRQGLSNEHVTTVFATATGRVWFGSQTAVDSFWQAKISTIPKENLPGKTTTSILEDHLGRLWLGMDAELYVMQDGHFRAVRTSDGKALGVVFGLVEGVDNHIYAVVTGNPGRVFDIVDTRVVRSDSLPVGRRVGGPFAPHPKGGIWLPRGDGPLAHYQSGHFESSGQPFKTGTITGLAGDELGAVWGASPIGIIRWFGGDRGLLTTKNGLPCNFMHSLIFDNIGTLWVSGACGYMAITRRELERWVAHPDTQIVVRTYDVLEGAEIGFSPFQPSVTKSVDGRLWFVNSVAVQIIDPAHVAENHLIPPVVIEQVQADGSELSPQMGFRLPTRTRDLRIDYSGLSFTCPPKVRFRYQLEGRDHDWQEAGTRRQAFYTDLPPGSYRFRVIASNNDGIWNGTGAQLAFTIPPTFTQSVWFKAICLLVIAGLIYLAYRFRVRQVTVELRARMHERLAERERIARDLHDTFFQGIQGLLLRFHTAASQLSEDEPARRIFEETLKQSDQVMLEGRELVLDLRATGCEQNDLATALADLGQGMQKSSPCEFRVVVSGAVRPLHPVVFEELFKISKEALSNAFRHSGAHSIEVELNYEGSELRIRLRDDGAGIDSDILRQGHRDGHFGLPGMRERARKVGAHLDVWSRTAAGTEIELRVSARVAYMKSNGSKLRRVVATVVGSETRG